MLLVAEPLEVDALRHDRHLLPVVLRLEEPHLLEDEVDLLAPLHRPERLDLELLHQLGRRVDIACRLLDLGKCPGDARSRHLEVDLHGAGEGEEVSGELTRGRRARARAQARQTLKER